MDEFNVNQIGSNLTAVANFYNHRRTELQKKIYSNAFGASNGYIISYLCENEDKNIFQRDIEREFDLSRSTVSTILKELEKEGLIERKSVSFLLLQKNIRLSLKSLHPRVRMP